MRSHLRAPLHGLLLSLATASLACSAASGDEDVSSSSLDESLQAREQRGVDVAGALSAEGARRLKADHGVQWTGVYIGGKCSGGSGWSRDVVSAIHAATGWSFLPTYVGQEAASSCNGDDPVLSYDQGKKDAHHAAALMASFGWDAHRDIPVALDVEQDTFQGDAHGTIEYVRGWTDSTRAEGYTPYVYGNPDAVDAFASARIDIAAAWVASYFYSSFEDVTPYDLHQIGNHFSHRDRAWQYAGNVWIPSIGSAVDCDAADLVLAPRPGGTNLPPPETLSEKIVHLALANVGKGACSKNSDGGRDFDSSCTGNGGEPEYWCADFARWVWAHAGARDTDQLDAAAGSFYVYGRDHGTLHDRPAVGDAVVFDYQGGGVADHVAIVTKVEADGRIETVSGDWGGQSGSEAHFAGTSHADLNTPAYGDRVGSTSGVMGMTVSGYVAPVK